MDQSIYYLALDFSVREPIKSLYYLNELVEFCVSFSLICILNILCSEKMDIVSLDFPLPQTGF